VHSGVNPHARAPLGEIDVVQVIPDEQPARHCPRAPVRGEEYSSRPTSAYLLSDGSHQVTFCGHFGKPASRPVPVRAIIRHR
jgi:hypothetical protein